MSAVVSVTILGDDASLQRALKTSETGLAKFSAAAKAAGAGMESAGRTMTHALTVPMLAVAAASAKMAFDYQAALTKTINLSGGFGISQQQLSANIMAVSKSTGQSATTLANALYPVQSSLHNTAASMDVLTKAAQMSAVGMGDATTTADALVSVMNVYGLKNMSAAKAADIFTSIVQNSKFKIDDLATTLGRVLPIAANAGISFQALGGDLASLSHSGLSADQAVTGMSALITNMLQATRTTGNASKELKALGLNGQGLVQDMQLHGAVFALDEVIGKIKDSGKAVKYTQAQWSDFATQMGMSIDDVKAKFQGLDLGQLQKMFPNRKAMMSALGLTDISDQAAQDAGKNVATNYVGGLSKVFKAWSSSDIGKINIAINDLKNGMINLGDKILPKLAAAVQNMAGWWDHLSSAQKTNIEHWALMAAEIGPVLLVIGKTVSIVGALTRVLNANPLTLMAAAFAMLYINSKNFRDAVNSLASAITPLISHAWLLKAAIAALLAAMVWSKLMAGVSAMNAAGTAAEVAGTKFAGAKVAAAGMTGGIGALVAGLALAAPSLMDFGKKIGNLISPETAAQKQIDAMDQSIKDMTKSFNDSGVPIEYLGAAQKALFDSTAATTWQIETATGTQDIMTASSQKLIDKLRAQGFTNDQLKATFKNMGVSASDANAAIDNMDFSGADARLGHLQAMAVMAANGIIFAEQAANAMSQTASAASANAHKGITIDSTTGAVSLSTAANDPALPKIIPIVTPPAGSGSSGGSGGSSATTAKAAAKKAATAAALAAAEAKASLMGKPLLDLESWMFGGLQNTGKDGPVTKAAKALADSIKKNYTVKGGTVPQAATDAMNALTQLGQQASSFNTTFQTKLSSGVDIASVFKGTGAGAGDYKAYLQQQVAELKTYGADLKILAGKGVPPSMLQQLAAAGLDGFDVVQGLMNASPTDLGQIIGLGTQISSLSQSIADSTESSIFKPVGAVPTSATGNKSSSTKVKDAKGHNVTVTVNNADAAKIAKAIALALQNAS